MGCGNSTPERSKSIAASVEPFNRKPKISVRMQSEVKRVEGKPEIIFIFGGPGSKKGCIVDDLCYTFGFKFISCESLVFSELPKKVKNVMQIESSKDIQDLLKDDSSQVNIRWILSLVENKIEQDPDKESSVYIIDYMPNLKCLLRIESIISECVKALEEFETKYPVSFALNLAIPPDKVVSQKVPLCSTPGNKIKETGGQSDEADTGRTQKRAAIFETSAKPFLEYFSQSSRLLTIDVTCGNAELMWNQVLEMFGELKFNASKIVNPLLLFALDDNDVNRIDTRKYYMDIIQLSSIVSDPHCEAKKLLVTLFDHINKSAGRADAFVINVSGTSLASLQNLKDIEEKPPMFFDVEDGYLENYLPGSPKKGMHTSMQRHGELYKAVCSIENDVCLFPKHLDSTTCRTIASYFAHSVRLVNVS